jgi:signal transduction histidine kinase
MFVVAMLAGSLAERLRATGGQLVEAQQRVDEAERLAALGRVAAALAHEIRNPLSSISGSIGLLRTNPALSHEDQRLCTIIVREAGRLDDLVSDMMNLAKPRRPDPTSTDAAAIAREVVQLASESGRAVSDVAVHFSGDPSVVVRADSAQLRQLIWNLVRNAVQASHARGLVRVKVERTDAPPRRAQLSVADDGVGLDEEARERIFDAFFTTRAQGTGVGLAVVKRIADDHGFSIRVNSTSGRGAEFVVDLGPIVGLPVGTRLRREEKSTLFPTRAG